MSSLLQLNYATLGHREFEVFPYRTYNEDTTVEETLQGICMGSDNSVKPSKTELWLVCDYMILD